MFLKKFILIRVSFTFAALAFQGRLDVHVDFKHASRWQAEGIFKNFYPTKPKPKKDEVALTDVSSDSAGGLSTASAPPPPLEKPKRKNPAAPIIPLLEEEELAELAKKFAAQIPEDEMSVRIHSSSPLVCSSPNLACVRLCLCLLSLCLALCRLCLSGLGLAIYYAHNPSCSALSPRRLAECDCSGTMLTDARFGSFHYAGVRYGLCWCRLLACKATCSGIRLVHERRSPRSPLGLKVSSVIIPVSAETYVISPFASEEREAKAKLKKLKEEEAKKAEEEVGLVLHLPWGWLNVSSLVPGCQG